MAMSDRRISRERMQFQRSLTSAEIEMLVADRDLRVLQTAEPVENETWELLNARFFPLRPDVELRIYGHSYQCAAIRGRLSSPCECC